MKEQPLKVEKTSRGFAISTFTDRNGEKCNIQESSLATETCIWLGCAEMGLKTFKPFVGWKDISEEQIKDKFDAESCIANTRMHLTQDQVKALLPLLEKFAKTGSLT